MNSAVQDAARNNRAAEFKRDTGNVAALDVCSLNNNYRRRGVISHTQPSVN